MTSPRRLSAILAPTAILAALTAPASTQAASVIIDFSGTQYSSSTFTETANGNLVSVSNDALIISSAGSASGVTIYNNAFPATGVGEFTVSADAKFGTLATNTFNGNSVGFLTNLSSIENGTGFVTIFRIRTQSGVSQADMRVFTTTNGTLSSSPVASTTLSSTALGGTVFASNTFYKFELDVDTTTAGSILFTGSILNSANSSVIGTFESLSSTYTANANPAYVGLRLGTQGNTITTVDNFTLTAIPEPSAFAAFGGLAALGFAAMRRRRA